MYIKIEVHGDKIKFGKTFMGANRIFINGDLVFEGKLTPDKTEKITVENREYVIKPKSYGKSKWPSVISIEVFEDSELIHSQMYDKNSAPVEDVEQARENGAIQICGVIFAGIGYIVIMGLHKSTGAVPGGAIGGALGGGLGGAIGYGIGKLFFGRK
jgi:hypothetical protein